MKKRLFEILDDMNVADAANGTQLVKLSNTLISAEKVKAGTKVVMGADAEAVMDVMEDKKIFILLVIDKKEYFKREKEL